MSSDEPIFYALCITGLYTCLPNIRMKLHETKILWPKNAHTDTLELQVLQA